MNDRCNLIRAATCRARSVGQPWRWPATQTSRLPTATIRCRATGVPSRPFTRMVRSPATAREIQRSPTASSEPVQRFTGEVLRCRRGSGTRDGEDHEHVVTAGQVVAPGNGGCRNHRGPRPRRHGRSRRRDPIGFHIGIEQHRYRLPRSAASSWPTPRAPCDRDGDRRHLFDPDGQRSKGAQPHIGAHVHNHVHEGRCVGHRVRRDRRRVRGDPAGAPEHTSDAWAEAHGPGDRVGGPHRGLAAQGSAPRWPAFHVRPELQHIRPELQHLRLRPANRAAWVPGPATGASQAARTPAAANAT